MPFFLLGNGLKFQHCDDVFNFLLMGSRPEKAELFKKNYILSDIHFLRSCKGSYER